MNSYDDGAQTEQSYGDRINRGDGGMRGTRPGPNTHRCCPDNLRGHESTVRCRSEGGQFDHVWYAAAVRWGDRRIQELMRAVGACCPHLCPHCHERRDNGKHEAREGVCFEYEAYLADVGGR
jgi:hypothetical protein